LKVGSEWSDDAGVKKDVFVYLTKVRSCVLWFRLFLLFLFFKSFDNGCVKNLKMCINMGFCVLSTSPRRCDVQVELRGYLPYATMMYDGCTRSPRSGRFRRHVERRKLYHFFSLIFLMYWVQFLGLSDSPVPWDKSQM
jgi:hypothetical protein